MELFEVPGAQLDIVKQQVGFGKKGQKAVFQAQFAGRLASVVAASGTPAVELRAALKELAHQLHAACHRHAFGAERAHQGVIDVDVDHACHGPGFGPAEDAPWGRRERRGVNKHLLALAISFVVSVLPAAAAPDPARIRADLEALASDDMQGRAPGTTGGRRAEEYLAWQFRSMGLVPAGPRGSYFQDVPLTGVTVSDSSAMELQGKQGTVPLKLWDDVVIRGGRREVADFNAPIVFVGFGIHSPAQKWDDYKKVDLHGKVALLFVNEPPSEDPRRFAGRSLTYSGRWTYKFEETARRGAVATLIIHRTALAAYPWEVVRNSARGEVSWLQSDPAPRLDAATWISEPAAARLCALSGQNLDALYASACRPDFHPVELPVRLAAHVVSSQRPYTARNVLAGRPGLRSQAILYSAHHDHFGIKGDAAPGSDNIYNGALDNASGCAVLLEIARQFAAMPQPPARTVVFAATTAEEQGLLGAAEMALHPPLPLKDICLDLNYDMLPPLGLPLEVRALGAERTNFGPTLRSVASQFGMDLAPAGDDEAGLYYRMDHFRLAQQGVPAFSVGEGMRFAGQEPSQTQAWFADYTAHHYHQPSDETHADWDYAGLARMVDFSVALGLKAAADPAMVEFNPGDEFRLPRP